MRRPTAEWQPLWPVRDWPVVLALQAEGFRLQAGEAAAPGPSGGFEGVERPQRMPGRVQEDQARMRSPVPCDTPEFPIWMTASSRTRPIRSGLASDGVFQSAAPVSLTRSPLPRSPYCLTRPSVRSPSSEAPAMMAPPALRSSGSAGRIRVSGGYRVHRLGQAAGRDQAKELGPAKFLIRDGKQGPNQEAHGLGQDVRWVEKCHL